MKYLKTFENIKIESNIQFRTGLRNSNIVPAEIHPLDGDVEKHTIEGKEVIFRVKDNSDIEYRILPIIDYDIFDVAWLYMLHSNIVYNRSFPIKSWENDTRMLKGRTCDESLSKFCVVDKKDGNYVAHGEILPIIIKYFGSKNFKDALSKKKEYEKYDENSVYKISSIPYSFFMTMHPKLQDNFDRIKDRIVDHFNSHGTYTRILDKLSRSRNIKEFNYRGFKSSFPDLPEKIKVYRGIKSKFDESKNQGGYSCWTFNLEQAERFAKFRFSGGMQFRPMYAKESYIIETEISFSDISVFIGGQEQEIILKNPVDIQKIYPLIYEKEKSN